MLSLCIALCSLISSSFLVSATRTWVPKINWVGCAKHVPIGTSLITEGLNLSALPSTLHCGQLQVPVDYSKAISASNNITLGLAMYRPAKPKGVLFFCPGGTDAGAAAAWQAALNQTGPFMPDFSGLEMYDLMMMDIRGTFSSNMLNVSLGVFDSLLGPYPKNQKEFDYFKAASLKMAQSFTKWTKPPALVQHTGTKEVVQDYESIRRALGYEKINFLGLSYGSFRAAQYAATYPRHVGNFVLDAIVPHGMTLYDQANYDIAAANRGLLRADAYCQNNASCPFHSDGRGSVPKVYNEVLAALQNSTDITPWDVQTLITNSLSGQPVFPDILDALYAAVSGQAASLGGSGSGGISLAEVVGLPYICSDYRDLDNTWSGFQKSFAAGEQLDPYHIGQAASWQNRLVCSGWPYKSTIAPLVEVHPIKAMLLVTADFDVGTPTEKATFMWKTQLNHSALVVRHGDDHTSFNLPTAPSTLITKEFLRTGILPTKRNTTLVTVYEPHAKRAPIPDPYDVPTGLVAGDCPEANECGLV